MPRKTPPPPSRRTGKLSPPKPPKKATSSRRGRKKPPSSPKKAKPSSGLYDADTLARWRERRMPLVCDSVDRIVRMRFSYYHPYMDEPEGRTRCPCRKDKGAWNVNKPLDIPGKLVHRSDGQVDVAIIENDKGFYIISNRHGMPTSLHVRRGSLRRAEMEMWPGKFKGDKRANTPPPPKKAKVKPKAPPKPPTKRRRTPPPPKPRRR